MDIGRKAQLLGFYAAASVRFSSEQKHPKNLAPMLLKFGAEIFGVAANSTSELADKIEALGKTNRSACCRVYRHAHGLPNPQVHKKRLVEEGAERINDFPRAPQKLALRQNQPGFASQRAPRPDTGLSPTETAIRDFYDSWEWKRLSFDLKLERGRKCECCGAAPPAVRIHTDHVKPIRRYWHLRLDRANLQILCEDCNMGKGSRHETDFRAA